MYITLLAAIELIILGFFGPFNAFVMALPNCVFAGASIACYGMIGVSAINLLRQSNINFTSIKNIWIFAAMLICGTCGLSITIGQFNINGICLAIIIGIILNLLLKEKGE